MRHILLGLVGWCAVLASASIARATSDAPPQDDQTFAQGELGERIVALVREAEVQGFSGAVLAAKDARVVAAIGAGFADLDREVPITPSTLFEIASVTKPFTATAIVRLVQDGKLDLDDPIRIHLPGVPRDCGEITIEHLLRHTSGIPGTNSQGGGDDINTVLPIFLRGGPKHEPGSNFEYWNQAYAILTEIVHRASGMAYTDYCRESIFKPAGMTLTRFTGDDAPDGATVAVGKCSFGPARSALDHPYGSYGFQYRGMGGIVTNVLELWLFDRAVAGRTILNEQMKATVFRPGPGNYGLGWFIRQQPDQRTTHSHSGSVRGFRALMQRYPDDGALIVVLANTDGYSIMRLAQSIEMALFEDDIVPGTNLRKVEPELAAALIGQYRNARGNVFVVRSDGGILRSETRWAAGFPTTHAVLGMTPDGRLALFDNHDVHHIDLERDELGAITSLKILNAVYQRIAE
jgi:CubicO group peptidase (beta-lactamase class C family)